MPAKPRPAWSVFLIGAGLFLCSQRATAQQFANPAGVSSRMRVVQFENGRDRQPNYFTIVGGVRRSGVYTADENSVPLGRLIHAAGGLSPTASRNVRIIRGGQPRLQLYGDESAANEAILAGDVVVIVSRPDHASPVQNGDHGRQFVPVACLGLADRPVVLPLLPEIETVSDLTRRLLQSSDVARLTQVLDPHSRVGTDRLAAGTVLIFDPQRIDRVALRSTEAFPPAVPMNDARKEPLAPSSELARTPFSASSVSDRGEEEVPPLPPVERSLPAPRITPPLAVPAPLPNLRNSDAVDVPQALDPPGQARGNAASGRSNREDSPIREPRSASDPPTAEELFSRQVHVPVPEGETLALPSPRGFAEGGDRSSPSPPKTAGQETRASAEAETLSASGTWSGFRGSAGPAVDAPAPPPSRSTARNSAAGALLTETGTGTGTGAGTGTDERLASTPPVAPRFPWIAAIGILGLLALLCLVGARLRRRREEDQPPEMPEWKPVEENRRPVPGQHRPESDQPGPVAMESESEPLKPEPLKPEPHPLEPAQVRPDPKPLTTGKRMRTPLEEVLDPTAPIEEEPIVIPSGLPLHGEAVGHRRLILHEGHPALSGMHSMPRKRNSRTNGAETRVEEERLLRRKLREALCAAPAQTGWEAPSPPPEEDQAPPSRTSGMREGSPSSSEPVVSTHELFGVCTLDTGSVDNCPDLPVMADEDRFDVVEPERTGQRAASTGALERALRALAGEDRR